MNSHDAMKSTALGPILPAQTVPSSSLPIELAELVLTSAIHRAAIASLWNPASIVQPLNALPRSAAPLLTKAALMHLPHVDLDTATKLNNVPLLRFMLAWSKQPGGRPVNHDRPVYLAMTSGNVQALGWWYDESGLFVKWDVECVDQACIGGHLPILQWWEARGLPHVDCDFDSYMGMAILSATARGHMHIVEWIWDRLTGTREDFWDSFHDFSILEAAVRSGQLAVLEWWMQKLPSSHSSQLAAALVAAFEEQHGHILEWCLQHPQLVEQYCKQEERSIHQHHDMVLVYAVQGGLLDWIDKLGVVPFCKEYWGASRAACEASNVEALDWLRRRRYLVGSRKQLMMLAAKAETQENKRLEALQWIHEHVHASAPSLHDRDFNNEHRDRDVFPPALEKGGIQVLDWLTTKYTIDRSKLERYFRFACSGHVLDWLLAHTRSLSPAALKRMALARCLCHATFSANISVLDWWKQKLIEGVLSPPSGRDPSISLDHPRIQADVIEWWLLHSGPFRDHLDLTSFSFPALFDKAALWVAKEDRSFHSPQDCLRILQLCWDARVPFDVAKCIHAASIVGNIAVLDWFLRVVKAPKAHFIDAFTSHSHNSTNQVDGRDYGNHADSLLWWWAHIPQVSDSAFNAHINRGPYRNPIHVHILKRMLKQDKIPWNDPVFLSREGNVAMLKYQKEQDAEGRTSNCNLSAALLAASEEGHPHVLEWWKTESGLKFSCPRELEEGQEFADYNAHAWWKASGLCSNTGWL